jgi:hypothetical protein
MAATTADRARWLKTAGTVGLAVFCALFVAMLATNWVVVDVRDLDHDRSHVVLPVPLNMLRIPLHMMPRASVRVPLHLDRELERSRCLALLESLRDTAEGTEVPLAASGGRATVCHRGGKLVISVADRDDTVRVTLPFEATLALLRQMSAERFEPVKALDLLAGAERGELVAVDTCDARIRIRTW